MGSSSVATNLDSPRPPCAGKWRLNEAGRVVTVYCDCGEAVFYRGAIHSRLVIPGDGTALCKRCRGMVRVPVVYGHNKETR